MRVARLIESGSVTCIEPPCLQRRLSRLSSSGRPEGHFASMGNHVVSSLFGAAFKTGQHFAGCFSCVLQWKGALHVRCMN